MKLSRRVASVAVLAVGTAAMGGWWVLRAAAPRESPPGIVVASGRLEGTTFRVGSQIGGRVVRLTVREGAAVEANAVIAQLDDRRLAAAVEAARADAAAAEAGVVAEAERASVLEIRAALARTDAERYRRLLEDDAVSRQALDRVETEHWSLTRQVRAAHAAHELAARRADAAQANVVRHEVEQEETVIRAPVSGVVSTVVAREGEVVAPGTPVVTLVAEPMELRVYLPLHVAGRVATGMDARVYVAALPDEIFAGQVQRVASEAEFTPKDVHMPDERTTLVYAIDIRVANSDGRLKDGFHADAHIRVDATASWPAGPPW